VSSRSTAWRNAASVLPEPVGAMTSVSRPSAMASHAPVCAAVGSANDDSNHARVAGEKRSRVVTYPFSPRPPTGSVLSRSADAGDHRRDVDPAGMTVGPLDVDRHLGEQAWGDHLHHRRNRALQPTGRLSHSAEGER